VNGEANAHTSDKTHPLLRCMLHTSARIAPGGVRIALSSVRATKLSAFSKAGAQALHRLRKNALRTLRKTSCTIVRFRGIESGNRVNPGVPAASWAWRVGCTC
jgi:hypothetical protein